MAVSVERVRKRAPFYAPQPNRALIGIAAAVAGPVLRRMWGIRKVEVSSTDLQRLEALRGAHVLFIANHPTMAEPAVLFQAFARAHLSFYLLTAWDTMTAAGPLATRLLQAIGCYSVRRGRRDRGAMETTARLLAVGQRVLAFPEGQTHGLNDALLPFQPGVLLMGLHAVEIMEQRGVDEPLWVVPLGIKYLYQQPMIPEIDRSLERLETALALEGQGRSRYDRLRGIALAMLAGKEKVLGLTIRTDDDLNARIETVRITVAHRLAEALGTRIPEGADVGDIVQLLANAYHDYVDREESRIGDPGELARKVRTLHDQWLALKHFIAVKDGYVSEHPSAERFCDMLARLELEVLGRSRIQGVRKAVVRVGDPMDLRPWLGEYRADRRETLARLTLEAQQSVADLVSELNRRSRPDRAQLSP